MNGPEHFREAEQLLHDCGFDTADRAQDICAGSANELDRVYLAAAKVHALLAVAAAFGCAPAERAGHECPRCGEWTTAEDPKDVCVSCAVIEAGEARPRSIVTVELPETTAVDQERRDAHVQ